MPKFPLRLINYLFIYPSIPIHSSIFTKIKNKWNVVPLSPFACIPGSSLVCLLHPCSLPSVQCCWLSSKTLSWRRWRSCRPQTAGSAPPRSALYPCVPRSSWTPPFLHRGGNCLLAARCSRSTEITAPDVIITFICPTYSHYRTPITVISDPVISHSGWRIRLWRQPSPPNYKWENRRPTSFFTCMLVHFKSIGLCLYCYNTDKSSLAELHVIT